MDIFIVIIIPVGLIFLGWIINRVLDRFFFKPKMNEKIITMYDSRFTEQDKSYRERLEEKDRKIETVTREQRKRQRESHRIIESLKRSGLSTGKLVQRFDRPLNAILISYSHQDPEAFIKDELARYNSKWLGGTVSIIPPTRVPNTIKNKDDLKSWFENNILKDRNCKLKFLILIDLKDKAYWHTYLPNADIERIHSTIGEKLNVEDLFTEEQIRKIALADIIRDGDIAWLASSVLPASELDVIHRNQTFIEEKLGNPSLRILSDEGVLDSLTAVFNELNIAKPHEVAQAIVREAQFWVSRLK